MTTPNAETLRAIEDLRQKRDEAYEVHKQADSDYRAAVSARAAAHAAYETTQETYRKAIAEAFQIWEAP